MNNHEHHICKTRYQGIDDLLARCKFDPTSEMVGLRAAVGRYLASDLVARNTLPNSLSSGMDGIGVYFDDFADGIPDTSGWERGREYDFCNTGIGIAGDYDTVIKIEQTQFDDEGQLTILEAPDERGENTVPRGSSMQEGELLIKAGTKLQPAHVGLAAQGGYTELPVVRKPRVAFIPSGNELVAPGEELPRGKSVECNSLVVAAKVEQWGGEAIVNDICPDDWDTIKTAITAQLETADILVLNAGSSKGTDDLNMEILEEMGEVLNHEFDHGPGRHSSYAIIDGTPVVGIAGPPVGTEFCADWYLKPVIDAYYGVRENEHTIWAFLAEDMPMQPRQVNVVRRVTLERDEEGYLLARPLPGNMKPVLKMCAAADGFVIMDKDSWGYRAGEQVPVELRYPYTSPSAD